MKTDVCVKVWQQVLAALGAMIGFDSAAFESSYDFDITAYQFSGVGFDWDAISDESVRKVRGLL